MIQVVDALQMMPLQELHLNVVSQHFCSEFVLIIEILSPPMFLQVSPLVSSSSLSILLSLTRLVNVEFPAV